MASEDEVKCLYARVGALEKELAQQTTLAEHALLLLNVIDTLARAKTFDEMCVSAFEIGRTRLGFDRVGIWFRATDDPTVLIGGYGTRAYHCRVHLSPDNLVYQWLLNDTPCDPAIPAVRYVSNADLLDDSGAIIGKGDLAVVLLCNGEQCIGLVSFDNVFSQNSITPEILEALKLLAVPISHFCARWHAQQALVRSEERYRGIFENSALAIFQIGADLVPITVNAACATMVGYGSREELMRNRLKRGLHTLSEQTLNTIVQKISTENGLHHFECEMKRVDGGAFLASIHARVVRDNSGEVLRYEGFMEDISERRRFETHVREMQKYESLGVLAGGIAHDFNNLLMGVLGNAELIKMQLPPEVPYHRQLENLIGAAHRAAELARLMLAYTGKGQYEIVQVNLTQLITEMLQLLQASISKKATLHVELMPAAQLPPTPGDVAQLRQVLMNLILNASEALEDKEGVVTVRTLVQECTERFFAETYLGEKLPEGRYVVLEVADTGCGIDPKVISQIFDPFFSTKFVGRGLGLSSVLGIIRVHRGAIQIISQPGEGAIFRIFFPMACQDADDPVTPLASASPGTGDTRLEATG